MIREMTLEDVDDVLALGRLMHSESQESEYTFNEEVIQNLLVSCCTSEMYSGFVAEVEGKIIGMVIGAIVPSIYTGQVIAQEVALYVDIAYRGTMTGARLIKKFIDWGIDKGADNLVMETSLLRSPRAREGVGRLYEKLGFTNCGIVYKMKVT